MGSGEYKNVDNIGIEIDHNRERMAHNERICRYLRDKEEFDQYFRKVCKELGLGKEMHIIDRTFHSKNLIRSVLFMLNQWIQKLRKKDISDNELKYLLKNDQRKNMLLHSIGLQ